MTRTTRELYADEDDGPILRFEEEDGPRNTPGRAAHHNSSASVHSGSGSDDPFSELKQKQESLLRIRQELERTQREAEELEARKQKEERFASGRKDICERLARSLAKLDRELYDSQKAIEEISVAREAFELHLNALKDIHPESWSRNGLDDELDRAIGAVDDAEDEYSKASRRLALVVKGHEEEVSASFGGLPQDFYALMRLGLAFSLPLIVAALLVALVIKYLP